MNRDKEKLCLFLSVPAVSPKGPHSGSRHHAGAPRVVPWGRKGAPGAPGFFAADDHPTTQEETKGESATNLKCKEGRKEGDIESICLLLSLFTGFGSGDVALSVFSHCSCLPLSLSVSVSDCVSSSCLPLPLYGKEHALGFRV